ncbi:flavodoxin [Lachnospira pectinoschiza]|uniref:Flavodoxin n=1 Tax=Lachnospira pectinoschiza TaxID=28052 RepID=A0A1G9TMV7_9FIRM|nr:flavodoxin [Lachnospira pectinoschiza]SDM48972.1 Flavodoxin [Lachnospira pectinoschiza]
MAKRLYLTLLTIILTVCMTACGCSSGSVVQKVDSNKDGGNTLIVYFSRYGNMNDNDNVDAVSSASILRKDDHLVGNTEYMAQLIQKQVGGDLYLVQVEDVYSSNYDETDKRGAKEQRQGARPKLINPISNLDDYDTVFIGFPTWYYDMPMPLYSFFDDYDLSGKTIVMFNTSGGNGAVDCVNKVSQLEPNASVVDNVLSVTHFDIDNLSEDQVEKWLKEIGMK